MSYVSLSACVRSSVRAQRVYAMAEHRRINSFASSHHCSASDTTVIVAELQCTEPGCPPLETAIGVLTGVGPQTQYKVHKAMVEVTHEDVIDAIHAKGHSH